MTYKLKRTVTPSECPWLQRTYIQGETVERFYGATYGCISYDGIACTTDGEAFFELPKNSIE